MSKHQYTVDLSDHRFEVQISPSTSYGYFEHPLRGDECGGGLWFEGKTLIDYDGVSILPSAVCELLTLAGYRVDDEFWPRDTWRTGKQSAPLAAPGLPRRIIEARAFNAMRMQTVGALSMTVADIDIGYCIDAPQSIEAGPMQHVAPNPDDCGAFEAFTAPAIIWIR